MAATSLADRILTKIDRANGYILAFAATCTATGIRYAMQEELHDQHRMLLFIPAVLVSAWYGGVGPGIFSLLFGAFLCAWILIPPANQINLGAKGDQIGFILYLGVGIALLVLVHRERQEKQRREDAQLALERLNATLELRVQERTRDLELANRELEGFCYSVSHDLRTPSRAISGNIHILMEDYGTKLEPPLQEKLQRVSDAAVKLGDLVDALLIYARLAKAEISRDEVNLYALIQAECKFWTEKRGVQFSVSCPEELLIIGDRHQLRTAVAALISNVATYRKAENGARLTVSSAHRDDTVTIKFEDDGIGFEMDYLKKIFQPFERLHRDAEYPGVGMGLANVARIAERHRGQLRAESKLGEGATFFLTLGGQEEIANNQYSQLSA